jgi:hypothetical protein
MSDAFTLVIPLRAKARMALDDFYDYWLNAHVTMPPRFPGISDIWLHVVSFDESRWPRIPDVEHRPEPSDAFHGVPEATFPTIGDLEAFQAASRLQMEDGINFLDEMIAYVSLGDHTATVADRLDTDAPNGHDGWLRHLLFLRPAATSTRDGFRRLVTDELAPQLASAPHVLKVRRHLFEEVDVTLDHPGVRMTKPLDRQYHAALEVVVADDAALGDFSTSPEWSRIAEQLGTGCDAVHAARVVRCITTKHRGVITLAGVRGVAVADVIARIGADSQRDPAVSALFLPGATVPDQPVLEGSTS